MENTEHTKYTRTMLLILAAILLVASILGYFVAQRNNTNQVGQTQTHVPATPTAAPTLIPYPVKGLLTLKEQSGKPLQAGVPFTLIISATSSKDTVAGYDVVLSYDEANVDSQTVQNIFDTFRIFTYKRPNHLSISATKNLSVTEEVRLTEVPILSLTFTAKKKGSYTFSLKAVGNESSKFVNEAAAVTYPETKDIRLEIN